MRLPIANCRSWFRFLCPQTWSQLDRTGEANVRHCRICRKNVYYCMTEEEFLEHQAAGHCVVVDVDPGKEELDKLQALGEPI
jgi:hypothetical protein